MCMKHFLNTWFEHANKWVDDVITSQFSIFFLFYRNDKNPMYLFEKVRYFPYIHPEEIMHCKKTFTPLHYCDMERCFYMFEQKGNFLNTEYMEKSEAMIKIMI